MSTPFGLTHLSVGVNKMDPTELSYSKKRYEKIVKESAPTLRKLAATLTLEHLCQFGWNVDNMLETSPLVQRMESHL